MVRITLMIEGWCHKALARLGDVFGREALDLRARAGAQACKCPARGADIGGRSRRAAASLEKVSMNVHPLRDSNPQSSD